MNFLLGTLLIILLLFPGFLFRAQYLNVSHGRTFRSTIVEELLFSIIPCILIHLPLLYIAFTMNLSAKGFYLLMINSPNATNFINADAFKCFLFYCLGAYVLAFITGRMFRILSERLNWEINNPMLRIRNEWYYTLTGTFVISEETQKRRYVPAMQINVDVVVELNKEAYIYRGTLEHFVLSKDDGIDRLFLKNAKRKKFAAEKVQKDDKESVDADAIAKQFFDIFSEPVNLDDEGIDTLMKVFEKDEYHKIPGDEIILPYSEIKNLNITYVFAESVNSAISQPIAERHSGN